MKKLKYWPFVALLFGLFMASCADDTISPLGTDTGGTGEDEDDPVETDPPPIIDGSNAYPLDSIDS